MKIKNIVARVLIIAVVFISLFNILRPEKGQAKYEKFNMTYLYFGSPASHLDFVDNTNGSIKVISPSYFDLNDDGSLKLTKLLNKDFISEMHKREIKVVPFLSNHWDRDQGKKALSNRVNLVNEIVKTIEEYNLDGINLDLENLTYEDRDEYTDLVRLLRENLPMEKEVSIAVAANPFNTQKGWQGSYDYKELGKYSDYLMIMTYDESYYGSDPGPVASIEFVEKSIISILKEVPPEKVVLGIPFYGRYWNNTEDKGGRGIHLTDVNELINKYNGTVIFDDDKKSPKATFTIEEGDNTSYYVLGRELAPGNYTIWYEDENSLKSKLDLVHKYNLLGTGSWSLGQELPDTWDYYNVWLNEPSFVDILNHWAKDYILWVKEKEIMKGMDNRHFYPNGPLTRVQGAATLVRLLGLYDTKEEVMDFEDVTKEHWGYEEIKIAKQHGIIKGVSENSFAPSRPITREEMAVMINRIVDLNGDEILNEVSFSDLSSDKWSYDAIINTATHGVFVGYEDGSFRPKKDITRGEMAILIKRIYELSN